MWLPIHPSSLLHSIESFDDHKTTLIPLFHFSCVSFRSLPFSVGAFLSSLHWQISSPHASHVIPSLSSTSWGCSYIYVSCCVGESFKLVNSIAILSFWFINVMFLVGVGWLVHYLYQTNIKLILHCRHDTCMLLMDWGGLRWGRMDLISLRNLPLHWSRDWG